MQSIIVGGGVGALCHGEAADLIEAYLEHNEASESSLIWHVAQMRANAVNLKLLDALVRYFERDYAFATSHIE